jgi:hypothetical protein
MTVYIVKDEKELHIYKIREDQQESFLKDYGSKILVEGDSIQDVLIKFGELPITIESPE